MLYGPKRFGYFLTLLCLAQAVLLSASSIPSTSLQPAGTALAAGRADEAISLLHSSLATNPEDAEAHNLLCQVYYQEERWDDAIRECETAVQLEPMKAEYHLWLGRAYGEKADQIHSIKAYGLAKKVRDEFQRAVELDAKDVDALSDLGEFYTAAPGIVGGGKKKAQSVAQTLESYGAAQGHQLKGRLAEKDKNYALAESEFKQAVEASNDSADAWMALASYYSRRHQLEEMSAALQSGIEADAKSAKPHGPALVEAASLLNRNNLNPQLVIQLWKEYLASPNKSADSPAFRVHADLAHLLEQQGDHEGARQQLEEAASLAREYHPASFDKVSR